jgi:hypothetical protein
MPSNSPSFETTTRIAARSLGIPPEALARALVPASAEHLDEVVAMRRAVFSSQISWDDRAYLSWRYGLAGSAAGESQLYVLIHAGQIIGSIGTETLTLRYRGREYSAQRIMDLAVARAMSDAGLGIWLTQVAFGRAPITIAVGATDESRRILDRFYSPLPPLKIATHLVRSRALLKKVLPPMLPSGAAAWLVDTGMVALRARRLRPRNPQIRVELVDEIPADASYFSSLNQRRQENQIVPVRSRAYLNHRAGTNPRCRMTIAIARRAGQLVGHAIWYIRSFDGTSGRDLHVVGCEALDAGRDQVIAALLGSAAQSASASDCSRAWLSAQSADLLPGAGRAGFWQLRSMHRQPAGVYFRDATASVALQDAAWALSDLENDIDAG